MLEPKEDISFVPRNFEHILHNNKFNVNLKQHNSKRMTESVKRFP
jgi:hypothetical protein